MFFPSTAESYRFRRTLNQQVSTFSPDLPVLLINFAYKEGLLPVCAALTASAEPVAKEVVYDTPDL
jgi:hypothetical protein